MFLGEFQHSLDQKGRLTLPAKFRPYLVEGCVVTKGPDNCLVLFPSEAFREYARKLRALGTTDRRARLFTRAIFAGASDATPDGQGRIPVPQRLREYSGIERDVAVVGQNDRIEVWDKEAWARIDQEADAQVADIDLEVDQKFSDVGI